MIEIKPITVENYDELFQLDTIRDLERKYIEAMPTFKQTMVQLSVQGMAGALFVDGVLVTRIGFIVPYPGVAEVWQIPAADVLKHSKTFVKVIRAYLDGIAQDFKFHRIQTVCPNDLLHTRWMTYLGFECEGILRQYTMDKQERLMYARLYAWE